MRIALEPNQVPQHLRGSYPGRKFAAVVGEQMTIPADAGLWSGGSRDVYSVIRLGDGAAIDAVNHNLAPWGDGRRDIPVTLRQGFAVVCHSHFRGKDSGLTFYVHPSDAAAMLPAPAADLTAHEKLVLEATASLKASYGGKDRYEMSRENAAGYSGKAPEGFPTRAEWETAKLSLISRGFLNKAGAITPAGKNARGARL